MLHAGLDLSRNRLDVHLMTEDGSTLERTTAPPDPDGLRGLVAVITRSYPNESVVAVIESMNGARFVHDSLELLGWPVEIADAQKVKGLAPLACKTDKIDAYVLAELSRRDLVPAIWLPSPAVRAERELARWCLHLVRHRTALKNRIHSILLAFGHPCPVTDLFGVAGRLLLGRLNLPQPWAGDVTAALKLIDTLSDEIAGIEAELVGRGADHPYVPLLRSAPGIGYILAFTIAAEIGDIARFPSPTKLCGYTGLCPRVYQSGRERTPSRQPRQERPEVPPLGAHRGRHKGPSPLRLRRALREDQDSTWSSAWQKGRSRRCGPAASRGDLAHVDEEPAVRSGRRRVGPGRQTALEGDALPERASH